MNEWMRVNWRAAIVLGDNKRVIHGRASRVGKSEVIVSADHSLRPGYQCTVALILPKDSLGSTGQVMKSNAEVVVSVLTGMQFNITLKWLEMDAYFKQFLEGMLSRSEY